MKTISERVEEYRAKGEAYDDAYTWAAEDAKSDALIAAQPKFPQGTPEYDAYAKELRVELAKWVNGES